MMPASIPAVYAINFHCLYKARRVRRADTPYVSAGIWRAKRGSGLLQWLLSHTPNGELGTHPRSYADGESGQLFKNSIAMDRPLSLHKKAAK